MVKRRYDRLAKIHSVVRSFIVPAAWAVGPAYRIAAECAASIGHRLDRRRIRSPLVRP
jgi:hypothetical protein